jgi:hypothetical protein
VVGDVGARERLRAEREHARHVGRNVAVADHDRAPRREVELELAVIGVAVVPGDELGRGPAPGQVLPGDAEGLVRLRAGGVDHSAVMLDELGVGDVGADFDVAEEAAAAAERLAVESIVEPLDLLVIGRDPAAQQSPRRRQPLDQIDLDVAAVPPQLVGCECPRGSRADDRHPRRHHTAVLSTASRSAKNSALSSST